MVLERALSIKLICQQHFSVENNKHKTLNSYSQCAHNNSMSQLAHLTSFMSLQIRILI